MRLITLVLSLIVLSVQSNNAKKTATKSRMYQVKVIKTDDTKLQGLLWDVEQDKLVVSDSFDPKTYDPQNFHVIAIYVHEIEKINIKRKGSVTRNMLIDFGSGFVAGSVIGFVSGDDPEGTFFAMTAKRRL